MLVWISNGKSRANPKFHARPDCAQGLAQARHLKQVELLTLTKRDPCMWCYPDAPKLPPTRKIRCELCNASTVQPCEHNGGVLVEVPRSNFTKRGFIVKYVWAENARFYRRVELAQTIRES